MKTQSGGHADGGAEDGVGHVGPVDVVEVVASDEGEGLDRLDVGGAKGVHGKVLHGAVVVVDVVVVVRFHSRDGTHGKDHVEQSEPWGVGSLAFEVISAEGGLVKHWNESVDAFEVGVDECLALPGPWDALGVLLGGGLLADGWVVVGHLDSV